MRHALHTFAHEFLRKEAFRRPDTLWREIEHDESRAIRDLWKHMLAEDETLSVAPSDTFDVEFYGRTGSIHTALIRFPEPEDDGEAYIVAICRNLYFAHSMRYFVLEGTGQMDAVWCEYRQSAKTEVQPVSQPNAETFLEAIRPSLDTISEWASVISRDDRVTSPSRTPASTSDKEGASDPRTQHPVEDAPPSGKSGDHDLWSTSRMIYEQEYAPTTRHRTLPFDEHDEVDPDEAFPLDYRDEDDLEKTLLEAQPSTTDEYCMEKAIAGHVFEDIDDPAFVTVDEQEEVSHDDDVNKTHRDLISNLNSEGASDVRDEHINDECLSDERLSDERLSDERLSDERLSDDRLSDTSEKGAREQAPYREDSQRTFKSRPQSPIMSAGPSDSSKQHEIKKQRNKTIFTTIALFLSFPPLAIIMLLTGFSRRAIAYQASSPTKLYLLLPVGVILLDVGLVPHVLSLFGGRDFQLSQFVVTGGFALIGLMVTAIWAWFKMSRLGALLVLLFLGGIPALWALLELLVVPS